MAARQATRAPEEPARGDGAQREEQAKNGGAGAGETVASELKQAIRDAALEILGPAARQATLSATKYAVGKAPGLVAKHAMKGADGDLAQQVKSKGAEALSQMGGIGGVAGKLLSKLGGKGKGKGSAPTGWGRGRRMPVQQVIHVSVPVRAAYNGWTEYKQWPRYMHRANQVDPQFNDREARLKVTEKMWGFTRPFSAEIVTQRPDEHIKWNSTEGPRNTGVINFHALGPRLTLIELNLDHSPSGPVEKLARGARFDKRAIRADFHRFRAWIEMKTEDELEALEGWRGEIEDGQIVTSHEDALEEEQRQMQPQGAASDEEPEAAEEQKPAAGEDGKPEVAAPERRQTRSSRARKEPVGTARRRRH